MRFPAFSPRHSTSTTEELKTAPISTTTSSDHSGRPFSSIGSQLQDLRSYALAYVDCLVVDICHAATADSSFAASPEGIIHTSFEYERMRLLHYMSQERSWNSSEPGAAIFKSTVPVKHRCPYHCLAHSGWKSLTCRTVLPETSYIVLYGSNRISSEMLETLAGISSLFI